MSTSRISCSIPTLINGISQQAPEFRLPSQAELQVNVLSSVVDGISKRPPSEHIAKMIAGRVPTGAFIHIINRDRQEQYVVAVYGDTLRVFDLVGVEIPVTFPSGKGYLTSAKTPKSLRMKTVADHTFVVNKDVTVRMDETEVKEVELNQAIAFVKKGIINTKYSIMVNGFWFSYTTPNPSSTVTSSTSGDVESVLVNAETWTWSECYSWLKDNNQSIPKGLDPYQWSSAERGYWYYRVNGREIGSSGVNYFIAPILNMKDADLEDMRVNGTKNQRAIAADAIAIKTSIRNHVYNCSAEMATAGLTTSVSTTVNTNSQPSTDEIAQIIAEQIKANLEGFNVEKIGSSIRIWRNDNADFTFAVTDSWGNEALVGIKREVQKFQDLPARAWDGFRVRVVGENPTKDDDYYLEYSSDSFYKNGVWKETRGWDQWNKFNATTMPHILVREANGTFTFRPATWKNRLCGDDYSVPYPTFVDRNIEDVVFFKNRLGLFVDENVVLSGDGAFFQFWPDSAVNTLATDPIDGATVNDTVSMLRYGIVCGESLLMFAPQVQSQLTTGGQPYLSPDTAKIDKTTSYLCSTDCKPITMGPCVYFVTENGDYSGVREYTISDETISDDAPEITAHVPQYLPKGLFAMAAAQNDGTFFALSSETPNRLYVYRSYWSGDDKLQSAWSHWEFTKGCEILAIATIESALYLVIQYSDGIHLERIQLNSLGEQSEIGHKVMLDRKVRLNGTYNPATDTTAWTLPYAITAEDKLELLACHGHIDTPAGMNIDFDLSAPIVIQANGNYSTAPVIIGVGYEKRYRFSPQYMRESKEPGAPVIRNGRLTLLGMCLSYKDSGYFQVEVTAAGRKTNIKRHTGNIGSMSLMWDKPLIESGQFRFWVRSRADKVTIDIVNQSHYPSCIQTAEWEATYVPTAKRI